MDKELLQDVAATLQTEIRRVFLANMATLESAWRGAVARAIKSAGGGKHGSYVSTGGLARAFDPQATYSSIRVEPSEDGSLNVSCSLVLSGAKVKAWADSHSVPLSSLNNAWRRKARKMPGPRWKRGHVKGKLKLTDLAGVSPEKLIRMGEKYPGEVGVVGSIWRKRNPTSGSLGYMLPFIAGKDVRGKENRFYRFLNWKQGNYNRHGAAREFLIQAFVEAAGLNYVEHSLQTNGVWSAKATILDLKNASGAASSKSASTFGGMLQGAYDTAYQRLLQQSMEKKK